MAGNRRQSHVYICIREAVADFITIISDANDPEFQKEAGLENWKHADQIRFKITASNVNGDDELVKECVHHMDKDETVVDDFLRISDFFDLMLLKVMKASQANGKLVVNMDILHIPEGETLINAKNLPGFGTYEIPLQKK